MGMAPLPLLWLVQVLLVALALAQVLALAPLLALALAVLAQVRGPLASPSEIWRWHIPVVDARVVSPPDLHSKTCPGQDPEKHSL